jgi:hypothetical protein
MGAVRLKHGRFEITGWLFDRGIFNEWVLREGRSAYLRHWKTLPARWFFGRRRARARVYREIRRLLQPGSTFARSLGRRLDQIAPLVREIAWATVERKYKDLFSISGGDGLVVVPRGAVRGDFSRLLLAAFENFPGFAELPGLSKRVLEPVASEAEGLFFERICNQRGLLVDGDGVGGIFGADPACPWDINACDGHYFYTYTFREGEDLRDRDAQRRFESEMKEFRRAQEVHLTRLTGYEKALIRESYNVGDVVTPLLRRSRDAEKDASERPSTSVRVEILKTYR